MDAAKVRNSPQGVAVFRGEGPGQAGAGWQRGVGFEIEIHLRYDREWQDAWEEAWELEEKANDYCLSDNTLRLWSIIHD